MVIRGGENIYPREVEEYLYRHPDIQDVQVFGVPDTKYGEELCAWIKRRSGQTLTEDDVKVTAILKPDTLLGEEELCRWAVDRVRHQARGAGRPSNTLETFARAID